LRVKKALENAGIRALENDAAPIIAFRRNPDIFPLIPSGVSLTIGHLVEGGKNLFVTSGIGTSILPVRFRVLPEISLLTIN
jgi:hypothetical protein